MTKKGAGAAKAAALQRRTFTREFKLQVIREVEAGKTQAQVARDYQLSDNTISKWRRELRKYKERAFAGRGNAYTDEARVNELERMVGLLSRHPSRAISSSHFTCPSRKTSLQQIRLCKKGLIRRNYGPI